jgi:molybdopterin biosynthesis enzyme
VPVEELQVLGTWYPNLLIGGLPEATAAALEALRNVFRPVIASWTGGTALPMPPSSGVQTLILHDVEQLSPDDQQQLLAWLQQDSGSVQVVATTSRPLLELVESAQFNPSLYYLLNVVYLKLSA